MQADISEAPAFRSWSASFWPTSGSIAALARWNRTAHAAKIKSGRQVSNTWNPEGWIAFSPAPSSRPRARS